MKRWWLGAAGPSRNCVAIGTSALMAACGLFGTPKSEWHEVEFELPGTIVTLRLPGGESPDFLVAAARTKLDLRDGDAYDEWGTAEMIERYWDYHEFLVAGPLGTLKFNLVIRELPPERRYRADDIRAFGQAVLAQNRYDWEKWQSDLERRGRGRIPATSAESFEATMVGGKGAIHYRGTSDLTSENYAIPLDGRHLLEVRFLYIDNTRGAKSNWKSRAEADARSIVGTVKLRAAP